MKEAIHKINNRQLHSNYNFLNRSASVYDAIYVSSSTTKINDVNISRFICISLRWIQLTMARAKHYVDRVMKMMNVIHNNKFIYCYYYKLRCSRNESVILCIVCVRCSLCLTSPSSYYLKNLNNKTKTNDHIAIENNGHEDWMEWNEQHIGMRRSTFARIAQDIWECAHCVRL